MSLLARISTWFSSVLRVLRHGSEGVRCDVCGKWAYPFKPEPHVDCAKLREFQRVFGSDRRFIGEDSPEE